MNSETIKQYLSSLDPKEYYAVKDFLEKFPLLDKYQSLVDNSTFDIGQKVTKKKGYAWTGQIIGVLENSRGQIRVCAEQDGTQTETSAGSIHIYNESQLELVKPKTAKNSGEDTTIRDAFEEVAIVRTPATEKAFELGYKACLNRQL